MNFEDIDDTKIVCKCGMLLSPFSVPAHLSSKRHKKALEEQQKKNLDKQILSKLLSKVDIIHKEDSLIIKLKKES